MNLHAWSNHICMIHEMKRQNYLLGFLMNQESRRYQQPQERKESFRQNKIISDSSNYKLLEEFRIGLARQIFMRKLATRLYWSVGNKVRREDFVVRFEKSLLFSKISCQQINFYDLRSLKRVFQQLLNYLNNNFIVLILCTLFYLFFVFHIYFKF